LDSVFNKLNLNNLSVKFGICDIGFHSQFDKLILHKRYIPDDRVLFE